MLLPICLPQIVNEKLGLRLLVAARRDLCQDAYEWSLGRTRFWSTCEQSHLEWLIYDSSEID